MAESCTGGGIAEAITRIAGSSQWFEVGFVSYSNAVKAGLLGVSEKTLSEEGAVSQPVVEQMASGCLKQSQADLVVAVSGIAGPDGGTSEKPVGTVWFGWATKTGETQSIKKLFSGDRHAVRQQAVVTALEGLISMLAGKSVKDSAE